MSVVTSDTKRIIALEKELEIQKKAFEIFVDRTEERIEKLEEFVENKDNSINRIDANVMNSILDLRKLTNDIKEVHQIIVAIRNKL